MHNQNWQSQMVPAFDDYLHTKNLRDCQISSRDADDKRTLLSDWTREATGHTQLKGRNLRCYLF